MQYPTTPDGDTSVEFVINPANFHDAFAGDLSEKEAALMAATQRPVAESAFSDASGKPAWKKLPSWAVVATGDKAAGADVIRSMGNQRRVQDAVLGGALNLGEALAFIGRESGDVDKAHDIVTIRHSVADHSPAIGAVRSVDSSWQVGSGWALAPSVLIRRLLHEQRDGSQSGCWFDRPGARRPPEILFLVANAESEIATGSAQPFAVSP